MANLKKTTTFAHGPAKAAYTASTLARAFASAPFYLAYYTVPRLRPHPSWTLYQSFVNHMCRILFDYVGVAEYKTPQISSVAKGQGEFVQISVESEQPYDNEPLLDQLIKPGPVGAVWVPSALAAPVPLGKYVCVHFHGGAFVTLSPGSKNVQNGPRILSEELGTPVLMVDYRLSCNTGARFPAALQDAVTAYKYILALGIPSSQILLSGDSAGANLVLALLRFMSKLMADSDYQDPTRLPVPAGAALWSPWVDLTDQELNVDKSANSVSDYITNSLLQWGVREYVPPGQPSDSPYFSPGKHPFRRPGAKGRMQGCGSVPLSLASA